MRLSIAAARDDARVRELRELAATQGLKAASATTESLDQETGGAVHQGVVAEVRPSVPLDENTLLDLLTAATVPALVLVLDGVSDPHNLGACLRTADAAGADRSRRPARPGGRPDAGGPEGRGRRCGDRSLRPGDESRAGTP